MSLFQGVRIESSLFLQVIRVKDSNSQVYSIPMYSSIEIGLVQSFAELGGGGKNTVPKITKASDIMAMKVSMTDTIPPSPYHHAAACHHIGTPCSDMCH